MDTINSPHFLLGLNAVNFVNDINGLPAGASGYINFVNETFYVDSTTETIGDVLEDEPGTWDFDIASVIAGVGLVGGSNSHPRIIGVPATQILAGATVVFTFVLDTGSAGYFTLIAYDDPDFNFTWQVAIASNVSAFDSNVSADAPPTSFTDPPVGSHKAAWTITSSGVKVSIDGGAIVSDSGTPADFAQLSGAGMEVHDNAILRTIAIYPPKSDAEMQTLSAP
jgi:hypothetical protein